MKCSAFYKKLKAAMVCGSESKVRELLSRAAFDDIHGYFCDKVPRHAAACVSCEELLTPPLRQRDTRLIKLLLEHGTYPSAEICASQYRYGRRDKPSTSLKRAVESGSVDDVRKLLSAGADVNAHPRICVKTQYRFDHECTDCDTPLMAAVRRDDVAMMRLLIAHGASVSEIIHSDAALVSYKSALLVAGASGNEEVITELVTSGVDVNQSLGGRGTVLHHYPHHDKLMNILVRLGADPNAEDDYGNSVFWIVLCRGRVHNADDIDLVLQSLRHLLPVPD